MRAEALGQSSQFGRLLSSGRVTSQLIVLRVAGPGIEGAASKETA